MSNNVMKVLRAPTSLVKLFDNCNSRVKYTTLDRDVDYAFVEGDNDVLYIYFEPSDSKTDWKVNFSFPRKPYKDMAIPYRVHGGFLENWKIVEDIVIEKIKEKNADGGYRWKRVITVGYSHGGALAALCHECVWFHREDLREGAIAGISFDGPRVFGGLYVPAALKERWAHFYVVRNYHDIVTHLPPVVMFFRHVGALLKIGAGDDPGFFNAHYPGEIRESLGAFQETERGKEVTADVFGRIEE